MKLSLALFLVIALVILLAEAVPARRYQLQRRGRARVAARPNMRFLRRGRAFARRGRTNDPEAPPPPAEAGAADDAAGGEGGEGDVPEWCDPTKPMGAWLNYAQIRAICGERGFEDFGPYGGIPAEGEEGEEAPEEA